MTWILLKGGRHIILLGPCTRFVFVRGQVGQQVKIYIDPVVLQITLTLMLVFFRFQRLARRSLLPKGVLLKAAHELRMRACVH